MKVRSVLPPVDHVRAHPDLYLFAAPGLLLPERLAFGLMSDAMHLGATDVYWCRDGNRYFVGSSMNWLTSATGQSDPTLFEKVVALKGAEPNSIRHEICVMALTDHVALLTPTLQVLKGASDAFHASWIARIQAQPAAHFGIAFVLTDSTNGS